MDRIIGVNSNCYHGYKIEDALKGIKDAGFKYVELTATKGWTEHVFPNQSFERLSDVKDMMKEMNLIPFSMSGHANLMDPLRVKDFVMNMKLARFFGCDYIVSSIGEAHLEDKAHASNEEVAKAVKNFVPYLIENDMKLVLELHGDHATGKVLKEIVDLVDSDRVLINYDTANVIFFADVNMEEDLDIAMDKIGYLHLKDKLGEKKEWNFPALGKGYVDFPMIFKKLKDAKNDSPFSIEIEFTKDGPKDLDEINKAVKDSYDYLKSQGFII
ncbi:MAG: sugar phosphate isomerase/epimerase family protein [Anaerovoracaceae bacterium]